MNISQKNYITARGPEIQYSRSKEFINPTLNKLQDITRFNSSNYNVYLYKSCPNRGPTPIKAPGILKTSQQFYSPRKTTQELLLLSIAKNFENIPIETKNKFVLAGSKSQMRIGTSLPSMTMHRIRKNPFILNDFHRRETNSGFARNAYGGFFTH